MNNEATIRAIQTAEILQTKFDSLRYRAPELLSSDLWEIYLLLSEHFGKSNAQANIAHVGEILFSVEKRRKENSQFSMEIDEYLNQKRNNDK